MSLTIQSNVSLKELTTFKIGGVAKYFVKIETPDELGQLSSEAQALKLEPVLLGDGSNMIFGDGMLNILVGHVAIKGSEIVGETDDSLTVQIGAGENWDAVVKWAVENNLSGIEAMSAIPGTAGATPIQNVGAYGQEITDTMLKLFAYDRKEKKFVTLSNADCKFAYRSSIFNTSEKGRYLIASITLKLSKNPPTNPDYPSVKTYFEKKVITEPTLLQIREAITEIRNEKLPDPKKIPNIGSFFKNTFVSTEKAETLKKEFPDMPQFPQKDGKVKISSGYLIERAGLKGMVFGNFGVYEKNALVLTHNGRGTPTELFKVRDHIIEEVEKKFGITLVQEPILIQ